MTQAITDPLESSQSPLMMCVVIGLASSPPTQGPATRQRLRSSQSDGSSTINPAEVHPPTVPLETLPQFPTCQTAQQENCSALARHLFTHIWKQQFRSKAEVATWCCSHIKVKILWCASTIGLIKLAGTKSCCLCTAERMILGQNFSNDHRHRRTKILNLKSEMRGKCSCKTRFLRFSRSDLGRGALMRV